MVSKKGGWLCHRRCFSPVTKSRVSTKGRLPSGDAPVPATVSRESSNYRSQSPAAGITHGACMPTATETGSKTMEGVLACLKNTAVPSSGMTAQASSLLFLGIPGL